ncbi:ATP-binding protein [Mesobacillus maritimus]|uniref:ATP-binding protein n=1 Tax=Mesobacillus maritimus TaxID=1643336 RepID=UPI00203F5E7D|nr:ATP-binding protein [Mesobacillus maritimus]MCM3671952.1 ATP-binding protein [Mesobacillus maritimus]
MMSFIKDLLLHFSIILFLGFMYNFVYMQKLRINYHLVFIISTYITLFVTVIFPIQFVDGSQYDLRFLPVFISFFYISPNVCLGLIGFLTLLSSLIGGSVLMTILNYGIVFLSFMLLKKAFRNGDIFKRISLAFSIYLIITSTRAALLLTQQNTEQLPYLLVFSVVAFLALVLVIYIIEMTNFQLKAMSELHKAEKFSAISQLAASVAHEIRNPITTIKGFMQVLKGEENLTSSQNMYIEISLQELDRTQTIINNFLSLARPNSHQFGEINLSLVLHEITEFMRPYSHYSNIEIINEIEQGLTIKADPHEFRQVIVNLVKNGIEAMPKGGIFYIKAIKDLKGVRISLQDEGIGMDQTQLKRIGNPDYSTKEKGTGLGLMISYDIIQRMKGEMVVESELGKGTTFTLLLPIPTSRALLVGIFVSLWCVFY